MGRIIQTHGASGQHDPNESEETRAAIHPQAAMPASMQIMREFRLRTDIHRAVVDGFALPMGIEPNGLPAPVQGYTVAYTPGEDDDPDTYVFRVVVSHERLARILHRTFDLLPADVYCIIEVGSRDAYRAVDVYLGGETVSLDQFRETWRRYEPLLLEDASIAAGANSEEPFVEVFVDMWKSISIHVPLAMRDEVEVMLQEFDLDEVPETWPDDDGPEDDIMPHVRPVLDLSDERLLDIDDVLLELRHELRLELNIDPESNIDDAGRSLGLTLWRATVIVEPTDSHAENAAYAAVWATAGSLIEMEQLIEHAMSEQQQWQLADIFTIDRIAYDERPDELASLSPRREKPEVHLVQFDPPPPPSGDPQAQRTPGV
jgi:hypothetical protein